MNNIIRKFKEIRQEYNVRNRYCTLNRIPFYKIAEKYLPVSKHDVVIDIGTGNGEFVKCLNLNNKYNNIYLLDSNIDTINILKERYKNSIRYVAPAKLPFEYSSVGYIHCSHIIEHLYHSELYAFLIEIDRILKPSGILVISTPLLWNYFYCDLSHIKPYYPNIFKNYLCSKSTQHSKPSISSNYNILELTYRFTDDYDYYLGSKYLIIDIILQIIKKLFRIIGIKKYSKNGYTIVLKKSE